MRKLYFPGVLITGLFLCMQVNAQRWCATDEVMKMQMAADPAFAARVRAGEKNFDNYIAKRKPQNGRAGTIIIPVAVHVVYKTAAENISDAQIQSQIDVLNEDFTASNSDYNNYDAGYSAVKGDADIQFCLDTIVRKQTKKRSFSWNDAVKKNKQGGSNAIDPMHVLNIWVCNLGSSLLGYAQFPGGKPETFGVVCHYLAFGRGAQYNLYEEFDLGRTTSHEIGHCFGLRHIWGDATCGNDFVGDTPLHNTANYGCPGEGHRSTCTGTPLEMWMNYMDYTDDNCMYFFSDGQVTRMDSYIETDEQIMSIVASSCGGNRVNGNNYITTTPTDAPALRLRNALDLYPTLGSGNVTLQFSSEETGKAEINVYNLSGMLVMKQQIAVSEGINTRNLDLGKLANGFYILQYNQGRRREIGKFIIQH